jgi:hypothetical protein
MRRGFHVHAPARARRAAVAVYAALRRIIAFFAPRVNAFLMGDAQERQRRGTWDIHR